MMQTYQRFQGIRNKAQKISELNQQLDFKEIKIIMDSNREDIEKLFK